MNTKYKCNVRLANLYKEPSHKSELITQIFVEDRVEFIAKHDAIWMQIVTKFNDTVAWVMQSQFEAIDEQEFELTSNFIYPVTKEINCYNGKAMPGSFCFESIPKDSTFVSFGSIHRNEVTILSILHSMLNTPYMWGGISFTGIDCSGLTQLLYRHLNIPLSSYASEQFQQGIVLDFLQDAQCGDLAFFENEEHIISHVGILLNSSEIMHATELEGRVVIDYIDNEGIINKRTKRRTHSLRVIKRI